MLSPSFDSMLQSCLQVAQAAGKVGTTTDTNSAIAAAEGGDGIRIVVYVCGFNNSCEAACKMYGQMLALSRYPPTFLHLLYSWPGGNLASYVQARQVCESQELEDEFFAFVSRLRACPEVSSVDLIGHSQGCRLLTNCVSKPRMLALKIRHLILASPEVDLDTFRADANSITANITGGVTVYTHPGDMALFWAQLVNTVAVQPHWHYKKSLGRCTKALKNNAGEDLRGVDVIDTSSLMSNVEELHHSFFYLSREMLEDMRTLLVEDVLASGRRERLLVQRHEGASVYVPTSLPPFILFSLSLFHHHHHHHHMTWHGTGLTITPFSFRLTY
jgi:esterase/lipase superfamily enzyme